MAYKVRERRRPAVMRVGDGDEPVFFERFFPRRREPVPLEVRDRGGSV
jgi:hypothetical protein